MNVRDTRNKRSKFQIAADRHQIEKWLVMGKNLRDIVALIAQEHAEGKRNYKLSLTSVHADAQKIEEWFRARAAVEIQSARGRQLASLEKMRDELWQAWEKSKANAETSRVKGVPGSGEGARLTPTELIKTTEAQCGDPQYMRLILDIEARIAKLLGLDMPETVDLTSAGEKLAGTQIIHVGVDLSKI